MAPGFYLIMLKGPWSVDLDVMEISLAINTPEGTVLVVGCGHPTIEKVVETARATIDKPLHFVVGGLHLLPAKDKEISRIAAAPRRYMTPGRSSGSHRSIVPESRLL